MVPPIWRDGMWGGRTRVGWSDVGLWVLLVVIVIGVGVAAWWPTRGGNGK